MRNGIPLGSSSVAGSEKRKATGVCTFRMYPDTDAAFRQLCQEGGLTPSAMANALVRDLVQDNLHFGQRSHVLAVILGSPQLTSRYAGSCKPTNVGS